MASHVWNRKRFTEGTVALAVESALAALTHPCNLEPDVVAMFVGYNVEAINQRGLRGAYNTPYGGATEPMPMLVSALRTKLRFTRGHNRHNYLSAGSRLLAIAAGLDETTPPYVSIDKLKEEGKLP
jgi:hypothetical protein